MLGRCERNGTIVFFVLIFILFLTGGNANAQDSIQLAIQDIDVESFPYMKVYVSALDGQDAPIYGLTKDNFTVIEDSNPVVDFQVSSVQNVQQTISFVIALDTSWSMDQPGADGSKLEDSIAAIKDFLSSIESHDEVALVTFGGSAKILQGLTSDISLITAQLDQITTEAETHEYDGMMESIMLLKDVETRPVVLLVSDGADSSTGTHTLQEVLTAAVDNNVPIYPIGFGGTRFEELYSIAEQTNGVAAINEDTSGLKTTFSQLLQTLREQYLIRYTSAIPEDDSPHTLEVGITYSGVTLTDSGDFIATYGVPPVEVKILEPSEGEEIGAPTVITAEVKGVSSITSVEFYIDDVSIGALEGTVDNIFSQLWGEVQQSGLGEHTIKVVGTDVSDYIGEAQITVLVRPTVRFINPKEGDVLKGASLIELDIATGFDADAVTFVAITSEGDVIDLGESTSAPFSFDWRLFDFPNGVYQLKAVATDSTGEQTENSVSVSISQAGRGDVGGTGPALVIGIAVVVVIAGILIPLALRNRRKTTEQIKTGEAAALVELQGKNAGQSWPLSQPEVRLGRKGSENDIPLKGLSASRYMASIRFGEKGYVIYSLNPDNPVVVNDQTIDRQHILQPGDVIKLGESLFKFERS